MRLTSRVTKEGFFGSPVAVSTSRSHSPAFGDSVIPAFCQSSLCQRILQASGEEATNGEDDVDHSIGFLGRFEEIHLLLPARHIARNGRSFSADSYLHQRLPTRTAAVYEKREMNYPPARLISTTSSSICARIKSLTITFALCRANLISRLSRKDNNPDR